METIITSRQQISSIIRTLKSLASLWISKNNDICLYLLLVLILLWNTGFFSDDLSALASEKTSWLDMRGLEANPLLHFTHWVMFTSMPFRGSFLAELCKAFYMGLVCFSLIKFFRLFFPRPLALMSSFTFLFYPSHEASTFFYIGQHVTMSLGFYAWAFCVAQNNKRTLAVATALAGSFISYGSTPIAFGFGLWFWMKNQPAKARWLILPNLLYVAYYISLTRLFGLGIQRIGKDLTAATLPKQYLLQILSSVDATIGISFICKMVLSCVAAGWIGMGISVGIFLMINRASQKPTSKTQPLLDRSDRSKMTLALVIMVILALGMFAVTGLYPQIAFNLGNRVVLYSALLVVWLLAIWIDSSKWKYQSILFLSILCAVGLSRHWRTFAQTQAEMIAGLAELDSAKPLDSSACWLTKGGRYSRLGWFDHIEGASEGWVASAYFKLATGRSFSVLPLSRYTKVEGSSIVNTKYHGRIMLPKNIQLLNFDTLEVQRMTPIQLDAEVKLLPQDHRHWIQLLPEGTARSLVLRLMPKVEYIFQ